MTTNINLHGLCEVCGQKNHRYMVVPHLWEKAWKHYDLNEYCLLCLHCVNKTMGGKFRSTDFLDAPINREILAVLKLAGCE